MKNLSFVSIAGIFIMAVLAGTGCRQTEVQEYLPAAMIRRANVVYDSAAFQTGSPHVPPYISNGILGGCFDHMGFQSRPNKGTPEGRTAVGYIDQYYMGRNTTRQIQVPLAIIQAEFADGSTILNMMEAEDYRQELDIYTGVLTTGYELHGRTKIITFAHQTIPNLLVMKIDRQPDSPGKELVVKINCQTAPSTNANIKWEGGPLQVDIKAEGNRADVVSSTNLSDTRWTVLSENEVTTDGGEIRIRLKKPENNIRILVHRDDCPGEEVLSRDFEELLALHTGRWAEEWEKCWVSFPTERAHNIWARSNYYNISNFPLIPEKALIPTGMNFNIWGFTFPQDVYYVVENLTRTNHFERYEKSMQYWLDILPEVKEYSLRIMDVPGGYYPWTPPFTDWHKFEKDEVVSTDSYELHNPAYVAAMVWHYYIRTGDRDFLMEYFPIMEEVWRFYTNIVHKNDKGTYDVYHHKSRGQDEASREERYRNLLCASYSTEYTARNYLKAIEIVGDYEEELARKAREVLGSGLERESLMKPEGYYMSHEGDNRPPNRQKHPVQINPITFLPMGDLATEGSPVEKAWENRHHLTTRALKPVTHGWTYGAFTLASSRMRSPGAFEKDLSAVQYYAGADPRWIQFYEFTFWERTSLHLSYYFPTQGLYQQAFTDALVQDWRGYIDLFAAVLPQWEEQTIAFKGLTAAGGVTLEGEWDNGGFQVIIYPGNKEEIEVRVSRDIEGISATGQKEGPVDFDGNQKVSFVFDGKEPIVLTY